MYEENHKAFFNIKKDDYYNVVKYFNENEDNRNSTIAKHYKLHTHYVNYILDVYLCQKDNYMGQMPYVPKGMDYFK